jgi:hypothetical protein
MEGVVTVTAGLAGPGPLAELLMVDAVRAAVAAWSALCCGR